ncbi:hypothetical protein ElyMa_004504600 [Elysia marginata]|uniref:Uncharacterized protein n=1 Tax=Elysia marginata TaxID=1093978 RepID=A0AAV4HK56_9GAST|nr:hypothetical protein ElyMa_004504600 [Elysia marginata]
MCRSSARHSIVMKAYNKSQKTMQLNDKFATELNLLPDGPTKVELESQCILSPSLLGNLSMLYRTDHVCLASVVYNMRKSTDLGKSKHEYWIVNNVFPLIPFLSSPYYIPFDCSVTGTNKQPERLPPRAEAKKGFSTAKKRSIMSSSGNRRKSGRGHKGISQQDLSSRRQGTKEGSSPALKGTTSDTSATVLEGEENIDEKRTVRMGNLQVAVQGKELEKITIELRPSTESIVEHALKLKAESAEVAEGVVLLKTLADEPISDVLEADRRWEMELLVEEDNLAKGKKKGKGRASSSAQFKTKSRKRSKMDQRASKTRISSELTDEGSDKEDGESVKFSKKSSEASELESATGRSSASSASAESVVQTKYLGPDTYNDTESVSGVSNVSGVSGASATRSTRGYDTEGMGSAAGAIMTRTRRGQVSDDTDGERVTRARRGQVSDDTDGERVSRTRRGQVSDDTDGERVTRARREQYPDATITDKADGRDFLASPVSSDVMANRAGRDNESDFEQSSGSTREISDGESETSVTRQRMEDIKSELQGLAKKGWEKEEEDAEINGIHDVYAQFFKLKKKRKPFSDRPHTPVAADMGPEVKRYLEAKGIHEIFESFMAQLLMDRPSKPLDYLIELTRRMNKLNRIERTVENKEEERKARSYSDSSVTSSECRSTVVSDIGSTLRTAASSDDGSLPPVDA